MSYYMSGLFNINTSTVCLYGQDKCYPQCSLDCGYMRVQLKGNDIYFGNWIWGKESECSWMNRRWLPAQEGHTVILFCADEMVGDACLIPACLWAQHRTLIDADRVCLGFLLVSCIRCHDVGTVARRRALLSLAPPVNPTHSPTNITASTRSC